MTYTYKFIPAGDPIQTSPKETFTTGFQQMLDDKFYEAQDWYTITEETSHASGVYQNVDVRINGVINPTTTDNVEDDFKKLLFKDIDHSVDLGRLYQFSNNYWITINVDKINTLAQTVVIKRCNNTLRWIDELTGAYYQVPCSLGYLINENRDYATAGSAVVTPSGLLQCIVQYNSKTIKIRPNQRFLFGSDGQWTAFKVEGGGINNFNNLQTYTNTNVGFTRLSLAVDYVALANNETDDLTNGIANAYTNVYSLTLSESSISGEAAQQVQLGATLTLNGETVTRTLVWSSSNTLIATVNSSGLVTFVAEGTCTITCQLENNTTVSDTCAVSVVADPVDTYQIVFSPTTNYVLEESEQTWTAYLYKNTVQQADVVSFVLDANTVPSANYIYQVLGSNSFKISNYERFLTDTLEVTATSGIYSRSLSISLRGAW